MILTDTLRKELLKSSKKVHKAPKRKAKNTKNVRIATKVQTLMRYRFFCQIIHLTTFPTLVMLKKNFLVPDCTNEPAIGDYVLVEFKTFPRKYYVGQITKNKDFEGDYEISCMPKKRNVTEFFFPEVSDLASVKEKDIIGLCCLHPRNVDRLIIVRFSLKFDYDFFFLQCTLIINQRFLLNTFHACYSMYVTNV